jgi:hypothetical protein
MDVLNVLKTIKAEKGASKETLIEGASAFATAVAEELGVRADEVAVLVITSTGKTLKFVWPPPLAEGSASFPIDHKSAIAASVLQTLKGKVDNRISESKHLRFYESVKGMETSGLPIQKMVALPLMVGTNPVGVVEVSRKGASAEQAGANFTPQDAQKLVALCRKLAPALADLVPDPFV